MTYWDKKILREQLSNRINTIFKKNTSDQISNNWISSIRKALGMSSQDLALKVGLHQTRISAIEKAETSGSLKISTIQKIANSLDMQFVYGFVPKIPLEDMVRKQAEKIAMDKMKRLNHTMSLELQELSDKDKASALKDMIDRILIEDNNNFWSK